MSANVDGSEEWFDGDGWKGGQPLSDRWVSIDLMAKEYKISVMEDETEEEAHVTYIAFKIFKGKNIYCTHIDPSEACLRVLKEMVLINNANP